MAKTSLSKATDDYDPQEIIQRLSDNFYQPDKFAEIFCTAAKKQKMIDQCLQEIVRNLLENDSQTRDHIKAILTEYNKRELTLTFKKIGLATGSIILLLLGAVFHAICSKYI